MDANFDNKTNVVPFTYSGRSGELSLTELRMCDNGWCVFPLWKLAVLQPNNPSYAKQSVQDVYTNTNMKSRRIDGRRS